MMRLLLVACVAGCVWSCAARRAANAPRMPQQQRGETAVAASFRRQVVNAVDAGEGDYTIRSLRARLAADPDNLQVRLELARRYASSGYPDVALEHYRLAAERFPESGAVQLEMAKCLRAMGLAGEAARGLGVFLEKHPQISPEHWSWLGILRDETGQLQQGEAAHREALKLAPNFDYLHNNLGYNLLQQGRMAEAEEAFRRALALRPDSKLARNNLGVALAAQGEQALRELRSVSDPATAHNNLACALIEQGKYAEARKELEKALGYSQNHPAALRNMRLLAEMDGKPVVVPLRNQQSGAFRRVFSEVWKLLAGIKEGQPKGAVNTASP